MPATPNPNSSLKATYRSIFLSDEWAHQKYFGWQVKHDSPGLRVLAKRYSIFTRYLVLLLSGGEEALEGFVESLNGQFAQLDIYVHDFDGLLIQPYRCANRKFRETTRGERLLNVGTYVTDLSLSENELMRRLHPTCRQRARQAEALGAMFSHRPFAPSSLEDFYRLYVPMAKRNQLGVPSRDAIYKMCQNGDLKYTCCMGPGRGIGIVHLMYVSNNIGFSMYTAGRSEIAGAGQFLQWNNMLLAKRLGCRWYDFGGVADPSVMDGIHTFKRSFGGDFVSLGCEYRCSGMMFSVTDRVRTILRIISSRAPLNLLNRARLTSSVHCDNVVKS